MVIGFKELQKQLEGKFVVIVSGIKTTIYVTKVVDDITRTSIGFQRLAGDTLGRLEGISIPKEGNRITIPFEYKVLDEDTQSTLSDMYLSY